MIDLNLPEILDGNDMTVHDIAKNLSIEESRILRLLRASRSIGLVEFPESSNHLVRATEALRLLRHSLLGPLITSRGITTYSAWNRLSNALVSSKTAFELHHDMRIGEYIEEGCTIENASNERCKAQKSVRDRIHNKREMCHSIFQSTLRAIPWNQFIAERRAMTVCDVGSGDQTSDLGVTIESIFHQQSDVRVHGIAFDLPHVLDRGVLQKDEFERVEGNLFSSVPSADVYLLKHILHAGDDETCLQILRVIENSLRRDGVIVVVDQVLDENSSTSGHQYLEDMNLFVTGGGRDRTVSEWQILFEKSRFEVLHIEIGSNSFCSSSAIILKRRAV